MFREAFRILRPGGRLAFPAFEVDPERVAGIPVLGVDSVPDYAALLETAGFAIDSYKESGGRADRVPAAFGALMEAMPALTDEMGEAASMALQMGGGDHSTPAARRRPCTPPPTLTTFAVCGQPGVG